MIMTTVTKPRLAALCLALCAWLPLHANAGLLDDDEARKAILDLRGKVADLTRDVNARLDTKADKSASQSAALDMVNQHEQTMQEIAKLRGQLEVLTNEVANSQKRQKDFYSDLDARIRKLEPRQVTIEGKEAAVDPTEQRTYEAAIAKFKAGDYKTAAATLSDFVRRYPDSAYAANAQFTLGNAYYMQRDYKNAIAAQETVAANYRDSANAPEAMLMIGTIYQTELKDKKNAKKALQALVSAYPDSSAAQAAKQQLATLK